jgi:hypothetical protein
MDSQVTALCDDQDGELSLEGYPAEHAPSLVEVAAIAAADRLAHLSSASVAQYLPQIGLVAVGLAFGAGLGVFLI